MSKKTGDLAIARKVWLETDYVHEGKDLLAIQIEVAQNAWAFENKFGVIFVLPHKVEKEFEDLGEL